MKFFELTKIKADTPRNLATEIQKFLETKPIVDSSEIIGPYLNLTFSKEIFFKTVLEKNLQPNILKEQSIVLEFSGPNTNKPLHLGHMRNHALGISMSNILEFCGANIHRVNIVNDRGIHICKSMLAYQKWGNGETPESSKTKGDFFVGSYYVKFEQESKKDPTLKDEIQEMLIKWEQGDEKIRELWKKMNDWTRTGHQKTYERQGVQFEKEYYESKYYEEGKKIALKGLADKVFYKNKDGAICINLEAEGLDEKVVLRPNGTSIYLTQDLAIAMARFKDFSPQKLVYIVADEQNYHFKVLFLCLEKLGLLSREKCYHLGYGLVLLPDGRMKSREGTVVDGDQLMNELKEIATNQIKKRYSDIGESEINILSEKIQNAAWKFFLLSHGSKKTVTFNPEKSIEFEGSTGPYLQYACVRILSILEKTENGKPIKTPEIYLTKNEKPLGIKILEFEQVLNQSIKHYNPTYLVTYLLELGQAWSSYYDQNSIIRTSDENLKNSRILLVKKVLEVLKTGLKLLGIDIPTKM